MHPLREPYGHTKCNRIGISPKNALGVHRESPWHGYLVNLSGTPAGSWKEKTAAVQAAQEAANAAAVKAEGGKGQLGSSSSSSSSSSSRSAGRGRRHCRAVSGCSWESLFWDWESVRDLKDNFSDDNNDNDSVTTGVGMKLAAASSASPLLSVEADDIKDFPWCTTYMRGVTWSGGWFLPWADAVLAAAYELRHRMLMLARHQPRHRHHSGADSGADGEHESSSLSSSWSWSSYDAVHFRGGDKRSLKDPFVGLPTVTSDEIFCRVFAHLGGKKHKGPGSSLLLEEGSIQRRPVYIATDSPEVLRRGRGERARVRVVLVPASSMW